MENINYLWLLSIYDILVHKQNKYHVKNHFISASSFCVVMKKAESVSTVLSLHHFILTYCLLNCCFNLISHLQTPLIIFKSCHSLQFIAISQSSIIINKALYTAQQISYLHRLHFVIMRGFVSLHNSAMNITPVF